MVSRRVFLGIAVTALNRRVLAAQSPNNQIVLGMIGVGGMGTARLKEFLKQQDVRIAAVCDVDRRHLDRAAAAVENRAGQSRRTSATTAACSI